MSAGANSDNAKPNKDLTLLAPKFRVLVQAAIDECNNDRNNLMAMVYEGYRSDQLQKIYYARGRTVIPPRHTVTNAPTNTTSWHGYGLAVDVVHQTKYWEPVGGEAWFAKVARIFKAKGLSWGGDWSHPDTPHFQWGACKPSPSDQARALLASGGVQAVWRALGAD
ncbi:MAG: M15 family metallopeptidase [Hyphomicrobiales bacterium]